MLMVDDYGYARIDLRNDPDLVFLEGEDWDVALDKKHVISFYAVIFFYMPCDFIMFLVYGITNILFCRSCADTTSGDVLDIV